MSNNNCFSAHLRDVSSISSNCFSAHLRDVSSIFSNCFRRLVYTSPWLIIFLRASGIKYCFNSTFLSNLSQPNLVEEKYHTDTIIPCISYLEPVVHDWCNKGRGMCYPVCGMVHIKELLLLIGKSSPCGGSGFPFSLSEWSLTICLTPYNRK